MLIWSTTKVPKEYAVEQELFYLGLAQQVTARWKTRCDVLCYVHV